MNEERKINGQVKWLALAAVLIVITVMYSNLYICTRMMDTVDKLLIDYPVIVYPKDEAVKEAVEEIEEVIEEEAVIEETIEQTEAEVEEIKEEVKEVTVNPTPVPAEGVLTKSKGTVQFDGHKETYYNLPMDKVVSNAHKKGIEGEYWVREDGAKMLGDYIMVAADQKIHPYGSLVETSLGWGITVDTGTFILTNPQQIDIAVNW